MKNRLVVLLLFLTPVIFMVWPMVTASHWQDGSLIFSDRTFFKDSTIHLSLINEMTARFPPTNFAGGGGLLTNYHYFLDAFLALVVKVTGLPVMFVYFRMMPVVLAIIFAAAIYLSAHLLCKDKMTAALAVFLAVFSTSLGSLTGVLKPLLGGTAVSGASNLFMTDQFLRMMVNPQAVLSTAVFFWLFVCLTKFTESRKGLSLLPVFLLLALSFGIKAHGAIVFLAGALLAGGWDWFCKRDGRLLITAVLGLVVAAGFVRALTDSRAVGPVFIPFWLIEKMLTDPERLNESAYILLKEHYLAHGNWWRVAMLNIFGVLIYFIGSLGLRVVGLKTIWQYTRAWKKMTAGVVFLFTGAAVSFLIPLVFNQGRSAYNIVQFTMYFTAFMGVMLALAVGKMGKSGVVRGVIIGAVIFLTLAAGFRDWGPQREDPEIISAGALAAGRFVQETTPRAAKFLLYPDGLTRETLWFPALAGRRAFYSGEFFIDLVGGDGPALREQALAAFACGVRRPDYDFVFLTPEQWQQWGGECHPEWQMIFSSSEAVVARRV